MKQGGMYIRNSNGKMIRILEPMRLIINDDKDTCYNAKS